jgi:hypothetical protein
MDWTGQTTAIDAKIINELLARVLQGFDSPKLS